MSNLFIAAFGSLYHKMALILLILFTLWKLTLCVCLTLQRFSSIPTIFHRVVRLFAYIRAMAHPGGVQLPPPWNVCGAPINGDVWYKCAPFWCLSKYKQKSKNTFNKIMLYTVFTLWICVP